MVEQENAALPPTQYAVSGSDVVAVVTPPPPLVRRQPGTLRGKIIMAPDFDTLPDDLLAMMEAEP